VAAAEAVGALRVALGAASAKPRAMSDSASALSLTSSSPPGGMDSAGVTRV